MAKKPLILEKKSVDKRKKITQSFRTTTEEDEIITEKAKQAKLTKSQYMVNSSLECVIQVIPEGTEILAAVQDAKNLIREFPRTTMAIDADAMFSKVISRLHSVIS